MLVGEVFARMGLDSKEYERSLDRLENVTKKRALTLGNILKNALPVTVGMTMFEAVKRGFRVVVGESISFNAQMEQARIGFTTMLGSAERAEAFLRDLADFAARTPFEFTELLDASKRMLAYGFAAEDVLPMMEAVGNATAALGLGAQGIDRIILALGQMRAKGKLSGEEMRQLTEAGIPAWEMLAEAMGKTTAEIMDMQSKGLIPADRAIKMLIEGMNKRYPDMMKNMENTWYSVTSTIKDVWRMTIGAVTKNLFQGVLSWLQKVRDFAVGFYETFQKYGLQRAIHESFGPEVAALVSILGAIMRGFGTVVRTVTGLITRYGKQIKFVTVVMGTYLALTKAVTLAKQLMITVTAIERGQLLAKIPVLNVVSAAMGIYQVQMALAAQQGIILTGVLAQLRVALYSLWSALGPIGWAILGLSVAVGVGINLWNKYKSALEQAKMQDSLAAIEEQTRKLVQSSEDAAAGTDDLTEATQKAGEAAGKNLQSFDEVHQLQEDMAGSAEDLAKSMGLDVPEVEGSEDLFDVATPDLSEIQVSWKEVLAAIWQDILGWIDRVKEGFSQLIDWVKSWPIWDWIGQKWQALKDVTITVWNAIATAISNVWNWLSGLVSGIFGPIGEFISTTWNNVLGTTTTIWDTIWATLSTIWNELLSTSSTIFGAIWTVISDTWNNLWATVSTVWNLIWTFLSGLWNNIWATAGTIWKAIADLITGKIDLRTAVASIWNAIVTFFTTTWGSIRSTASGIWAAIAGFIIGTWEGLKSTAGTIWNALTTFFSNTWDNIKNAVEVIWTAIKTFFITTWENLKDTALTVWQTIERYIVDPIQRAWTWLYETWGKIVGFLERTWNGIKTTAEEKWEGVKTVIKGALNGIIGFINKFIKAWNKIELKVPSINIPLFGTVGGWTVSLPKIQEIPMLAKGGLVTAPTLAMLGEAGPEAVVPLGRSGFAGDLADTVAQAVYQAMMDAIRISQASSPQSSDAKELVLKIDNTVLARMQLPALTREAERQGFDLVLRPQGV